MTATAVLLAALLVADPPADKLPLSGLAPAAVEPNLCLYSYPNGARTAEARALVDQGLGYYQSYVWMEAARSFETAARLEPDCAVAWWGLSLALDKWKKPNSDKALERAKAVHDKAGHREGLLVKARLQEKGLWPGVAAADRAKEAAKTLDEMLAVYDDDQEAWYARGQLAGGAAAVPYYKALLRVNPLHPGANHELVHHYENIKRPALGWPHAEKYLESSPGIPHAFHMQAHLATRLGKWDKTGDRSARAVELETAYHRRLGVKPADDHQYSHHLETLTASLVHDGRLREARAVQAEAKKANLTHAAAWFRLHLAARDWPAAEESCNTSRKKSKTDAAYMAAVLALEHGDRERAAAEIDILRAARERRRGDHKLQYQLWEAQGRHLCATGSPDEGLKLLERAADRSKADYGHHAWGNGAALMEVWGRCALLAGRESVAEEAFQEALAHDPGSARAALGMAGLCRAQGRDDEASRYDALARRLWSRADPADFEALREQYSAPAVNRSAVAPTTPTESRP